jgi:cob(I)alamin adenosyltransferase
MGKSRVYTKTGDKGFTSLVGGKRVPKTHVRLDAYGTVDELNSFIGLLSEEIEDHHTREILSKIQSSLFTVGCTLATEEDKDGGFSIKDAQIGMLEDEIDRMDSFLPKLNNFILPGGCKSAALAHVCRSICRRAERNIYRIDEFASSESLLLIFINRLSDYFFVLARKECLNKNEQEVFWQKSCE